MTKSRIGSVYSNNCMTFVDGLFRYLGFITPNSISQLMVNCIYSIIPHNYMQEVEPQCYNFT